MFKLHLLLQLWHPTDQVQGLSADMDESQKDLLRVLDELESIFLSWNDAGCKSAVERLRLTPRKNETSRNLRALERVLPDDGDYSEELVYTLTAIIRLEKNGARNWDRLLQIFEKVPRFFFSFTSKGRVPFLKAERGLCHDSKGAKAGTLPRMAVFRKYPWRIPAMVDTNRLSCSQVLDNAFRSLKILLQPNQDSGEPLLSSTGGKYPAVLSFILATSLAHFIRGPWLQAGLKNKNISFLASHSQTLSDITKPYLTDSFSSTGEELLLQLNQPLRFPDIVSLGILLLEIARGFAIDFNECDDRCVTALNCMNEWIESNRIDASDWLCQAILVCVDPEKLRNVFDRTRVRDFELSKYIVEGALYPLQSYLFDTHGIQLDALHRDVSQAKKVNLHGCCDHQDENRREKHTAANIWEENFGGVYTCYYECQARCESLPKAKQEAARPGIILIDTGCELPRALQENYETEGRINALQSQSFVPPTDGEGTHEWRMDLDGHGSRISQIILKYAPAANLTVLKVFKSGGDLADPGMATQLHNRIAAAIDYGYKLQPDIIVMSFGYDEPIGPIRDAMVRASRTDKPPLFFSAAGNDAAHKPMAWPARDHSVIGICSTDGYGKASSFNPSDKEVDAILYAFGEGIPVKVADRMNPDASVTNHVTGTSYATAVAAALAANLLGCVRMAVATSSQEDQIRYSHLPADLQRLDGMLAVLRHRMRKEHNCGTKSLLPWDFLNIKELDGNKLLKDVYETLTKG